MPSKLNSSSIATRNRPQTFEAMIGQSHVTTSLRKCLDARRAQTFLLAGPSGCGKTTLARIAADYVGCSPSDILDVDAATYSGIDNVRELQLVARNRPIGGGESRAMIIDECHGLSGKAWDALLKIVEEPNPHMHWFFCTTNPAKVPKTVKTRCTTYTLKDVADAELEKLVRRVAKKEKLDPPDGVIAMIVREAKGSPRQALTNLGAAADCETSKEAAAVLQSALESDATIELCRFLLAGGSWSKAMGIVNKFENESAESVRYVIINYFAAVAKGSKSDDKASAALHIIDCFSTPFNSGEGMAPLLLALGRALLQGD